MAQAAHSVEQLWAAFAARDWDAAARWLAPDVVVRWPQSAESFVGRDPFIAMNRSHPAPNWRIDKVEIMVASGPDVAARVVVATDEAIDVCLGYYRVNESGIVVSALEYWTEHRSKETPAWRAKWTTRLPPF